MSVTLERVPAVVDRTTACPPVVMLFPFTSFKRTVIRVVDVPFRSIELDAAVIVEVNNEGVGEVGLAAR